MRVGLPKASHFLPYLLKETMNPLASKSKGFKAVFVIRSAFVIPTHPLPFHKPT